MSEEICEDLRPEGAMSRRTFIAASSLTLGSVMILGTAPAALAADAEEKEEVSRYAILYDTTKCVGCHICEKACMRAHNLAGSVTYDISKLTGKLELKPKDPIQAELSAKEWLRVEKGAVELGDSWTTDVYTRHSCMHCGLCAKVCPSGAVTQREDGIVVMDTERCFGCKYCYQACPFDIPRYRTGEDGGDKAMQKCNMCAERIDKDGIPACVEICPMNALEFGKLEMVTASGETQVVFLNGKGNTKAKLYGATELGGTGLLQVLKYPVENYELPEL